jgi:hypothetical protein
MVASLNFVIEWSKFEMCFLQICFFTKNSKVKSKAIPVTGRGGL